MTDKPSNTEEEYFVREDAERLRKLHHDGLAQRSQAEQAVLEAQRAQYRGHCANCGSLMFPETVAGLQVQHCRFCGGAFLEKAAWEHLHGHAEPHSVMTDVLNWFKAANKP